MDRDHQWARRRGRSAAEHPELEACFAGWICGDDVTRKKPDPEAYAMALGHLKLPA